MGKILVTGATGFIGSHLCEELVRNGFDVKAFDRYNISNSYTWLEDSDVRNEIEFELGDIRDYDSVKKSMHNCSSVFHLAALIGIPYSYVSPLAYIRTNIEGTYNILEASKDLNLEQVLITSTSETYGSAQYIPIDEKHPLVGQSPYSASKISADQLAISYINSFDQPIKIVRPFNTYGPRQSSRAVIPTIISQLKDNSEAVKIGNLDPKRDLTFVGDTVRGFIEIYKKNFFFHEVTNIGSGNEISIKELLKMIAEIMEINFSLEQDRERVRPKKSEVDRLFCDNKKIIENSEWRPKTNLRDGLKKTIDWVVNQNNLFNSKKYHI